MAGKKNSEKAETAEQMEMAERPPLQPGEKLNDEPSINLNDLSANAWKAEAYAKHLPDEPMRQTRCHRCNHPMWTWSDKEVICERCGFEMRRERVEQSKKSKNKKGTNAFKDNPKKHVKVGLEAKKQRS